MDLLPKGSCRCLTSVTEAVSLPKPKAFVVDLQDGEFHPGAIVLRPGIALKRSERERTKSVNTRLEARQSAVELHKTPAGCKMQPH